MEPQARSVDRPETAADIFPGKAVSHFFSSQRGRHWTAYRSGGQGYLASKINNVYIHDRGEYRIALAMSGTWRRTYCCQLSRRDYTRPKQNRYDTPPVTGGVGTGATGACDAGLNVLLKNSSDHRTPSVGITNVAGFGPSVAHANIRSQRVPATVDVVWTKQKHIINFGVNYVTAPFPGSATTVTGGGGASAKARQMGLTNYSPPEWDMPVT